MIEFYTAGSDGDILTFNPHLYLHLILTYTYLNSIEISFLQQRSRPPRMRERCEQALYRIAKRLYTL